MRFDIFTLFPDVFNPYLEASILQRARQRGQVEVHLHNIRDWALDRHHITDDLPYGGGGGMIMKPDPIFSAVEAVLGAPPACPVILMTPQGRVFNHKVAAELASLPYGACLVDTSRGGIVDHTALVEMLTSGHLRGAALDVFPEEPLPPSSPLWKLPNVILTPHISGFSSAYDERAVDLFAENLNRYLANLPLYNRIDPENGY